MNMNMSEYVWMISSFVLQDREKNIFFIRQRFRPQLICSGSIPPGHAGPPESSTNQGVLSDSGLRWSGLWPCVGFRSPNPGEGDGICIHHGRKLCLGNSTEGKRS